MKKLQGIQLAVVFIFFVLQFSCKKSEKYVPTKKTRSPMYFPVGSNACWVAYWNAWGTGDTNFVQNQIDSIFLSNDTIGLNIISVNNAITDTTWKAFNILKVHILQRRSGVYNWDDKGIKNCGIYRIDTANNKIYSVNTDCFCWPGGQPIYPTNFYFNERVIYDHNLQNNDTLTIKATWYSYSTTVHLDSVLFAGQYLKKQYFIDNQNFSDTVTTRMQLACILNTSDYTHVALDNSTRLSLGFYNLMFHNGLNDSIELMQDTHIYP